MASVSTPKQFHNLQEAHRQVRHPLERLRGYIRRYVSLEGAAIVGLFLALWFWIGLALDYGFFKLFAVDWVQTLPWAFRASVLLVLVTVLTAILGLNVFTRLFREFRDTALALLLERRFPGVLGDRLITAVELSDPEQAAKYGYSAAMVRETIHEAARRVETVPVQEVFDWKRLTRRALVVILLVAGGYLLVGGIFAAVASARAGGFSLGGYNDFHEVGLLWFQRNVLLQNRIWPRRAHLELVDFPASGEIRMGRGGTPPTIRARALKYVVSGAPSAGARDAYASWLDAHQQAGIDKDSVIAAFTASPSEGWRALSWFDLTPELVGGTVPSVTLPEDWSPRNPAAGLTLDEIELKMDKEETHKTLLPEVQQALRDVLAQVELRARTAGMGRTLRVLKIPDEAFLNYWGGNTNSRNTLQKVGDNEYTGQFGDLRESVTFAVQGEDYYTASRHVTVVDPPALDSLTRVEERPAYLYYRTAKPEDLRGAKQVFEETQVSLQGGEVSRIDLPAGSNVTLTAVASKELTEVRVTGLKSLDGKVVPVQLLDSRTFQARFDNVRQEVHFTFEFTDTDGVIGQRKVLLVAAEDAPPKVRELAPDEIIRKVKEGYMVAVGARIPFKGKVSDDYGLSDVRYTYSISRFESGLRANDRLRLHLATMGLATLVPGAQRPLIATCTLSEAFVIGKAAEKAEKPKTVETFALPRFEQMLRERKETPPLASDIIRNRLETRQKLPYRSLLNEFEIRPDEWTKVEEDPIGCDFPLWKLNLKVTDPRLTQPRYQMDIRLEAADTDLDGALENGKPRPHVKLSEEKFTFIVVSETELLAEIAKEEEKLFSDMEGAINKLLETQSKFIQVNLDLSGFQAATDKPEVLGPMSVRCEQVVEALDKGQIAVREVATAYQKIDKEMRTNQLDAKLIEKVEATIVKPLAEADVLFDRTRDRVVDFRKSLDNNELALDKRVEAAKLAGGVAKAELQGLLDHLNRILGAMQGITDINKLIKMIAEIEKQEGDNASAIKTLKDKLERDILEGALDDDKPKEKKK
jgi:hypothetical protein